MNRWLNRVSFPAALPRQGGREPGISGEESHRSTPWGCGRVHLELTLTHSAGPGVWVPAGGGG